MSARINLKALDISLWKMISEREPAAPPDMIVSERSARRVWLRRIWSLSSSTRASRSRRRTLYVAPSIATALPVGAVLGPEGALEAMAVVVAAAEPLAAGFALAVLEV